MDKKQYLTLQFDEYQEINDRRLKKLQVKERDIEKDLPFLIPYMIVGHFNFLPGFDRNAPSLSISQFNMTEKIRSLIRGYLNVKNVPIVGTKLMSDITAIYLYPDQTSSTIDFFIFYNSKHLLQDKENYINSKIKAIEEWCYRRFKISISINKYPDEDIKILHTKTGYPLTILDFYHKAIHLVGKHSFMFLMKKGQSERSYIENKKLISNHNWLNIENFFDISHYTLSKSDFKSIIEHYLEKTLIIDFKVFHQLIYYHSLGQTDSLTKIFQIASEDQYEYELSIIYKYSGFPFKDLMVLEYLFLQHSYYSESDINYFLKHLARYEELDFIKHKTLNLKDIFSANYQLKKILNLLIEIYNYQGKPLLSLLEENVNGISYENFVGVSVPPENTLIRFFNNKWGLYDIKKLPHTEVFEEVFTTNSLIKTIVVSIYNKYIDKIIPQIKAKNRSLVDENNNFNRLKNKLLKYDIKFSYPSFLKNINKKLPYFKTIYIFLNFSVNSSKSRVYKDYNYISEKWDPLNYGYKQTSKIRDMVLIAKNSSEKLYYYEYQSDESLILAIQNLFYGDYDFYKNIDISINLFDSELSPSLIFRLKKLLKVAYEVFSNPHSILLTSFNGVIYLLKKGEKNIDFMIYDNRDRFFKMLKDGDRISNYYIDEDVIELSHFSKIVKSLKENLLQIFYFTHPKGNLLYIFDETNRFYYFKNFNINLLSDIVALSINHVNQTIDNELELELYNIEEKELNVYELVQMDINRFKEYEFVKSNYKCKVDGIKRGNENYFNYTIGGKVFKYKDYGAKTFFQLLKYIGIENINLIRFIDLKTFYIKSGVKHKSFKYKLIIYEELKTILTKVKERWKK